jgi:uncharacterized protein
VDSEQRANVKLLETAYGHFAKGDVARTLALYDDSIVFHVPGSNPLAGDHVGKQAVGATLRKFRELSGGTFQLRPTQILANDTYATVLAETSASREGKTIAEQPIQLWRFEDGEPVELWLYPRDQRSFDEFWSGG